MSLLICGATIIDGAANAPIEGHAIWVEKGRIRAVGRRGELSAPPSVQVIDARGKYVIPGLMDANVHLLLDMRLENLVRHEDRYEELIIEAAQVALKNGLTTVFDTWGPRQHLIVARDKINAGKVAGSRIFCAGNIIGLGGPFSEDFLSKTSQIASGALVDRIESIWSENVGPALTWMAPEQIAPEVRAYVARGIDFVKYAASEHRIPVGASAFLAFSPRAQQVIVEEAHRVGLTAQAHSSSVEALRVAIEAGCDLIQHANSTGPTPIPEVTLELLVERKTASTVFPITKRRYEWIRSRGDVLTSRLYTPAHVEINIRNLIRVGATLLLATDAGLVASEVATDPTLKTVYAGEENLFELGQGHFNWLKAMEEKGLPPMEALKAATRNIAVAYRKEADLGTIAAGKMADMLILDRNPLLSAENYRSIHMILKSGAVVDRATLPLNPILTKLVERSASADALRPLRSATGGFPGCCC